MHREIITTGYGNAVKLIQSFERIILNEKLLKYYLKCADLRFLFTNFDEEFEENLFLEISDFTKKCPFNINYFHDNAKKYKVILKNKKKEIPFFELDPMILKECTGIKNGCENKIKKNEKNYLVADSKNGDKIYRIHPFKGFVTIKFIINNTELKVSGFPFLITVLMMFDDTDTIISEKNLKDIHGINDENAMNILKCIYNSNLTVLTSHGYCINNNYTGQRFVNLSEMYLNMYEEKTHEDVCVQENNTQRLEATPNDIEAIEQMYESE